MFHGSGTATIMFKFDVVLVLLLSVLSFVVCQVSFDSADSYFENDVCDTFPYSTCQRVSNCPSALEDITNGGHPKICSFEGNEPLVCCEGRGTTGSQQGKVEVISTSDPSVENTFGRLINSTEVVDPRSKPSSTITTPLPIPNIENTKCVQKCREYGSTMCRTFAPYVAGGTKAKPKELPHMALIGFGPENDKSWQCGGSVISKRFILSAAHCTFPGGQTGIAKWVRLGDLDHSSSTDNTKHEDYTIIERINHPGYNPPLLYNDIALYKVDREIIFNDFIKPICLHTTFDISAREGKAAGWGRTEFVGPTSDHLLYANISFIHPEKCKNSLEPRLARSQFPDGLRTNSIVCAGEADGSKDTCQGDSGGPLFIHQSYPWPSCLFRQVGVTSSGIQCAQENSPGLYTRVSNYIPWIESVVWAKDP